jgi:phospholipid-binding lipoprotein MlaA
MIKTRLNPQLGMACMFALVLTSAQLLAEPTEEADFLTEDDLFDEPIEGMVDIADPLEPFNRVIFRFNDVVYRQAVEPISRFYSDVIPDPVDRGLTRFFRNFRYPIRLVSNLVQGDLAIARIETERFIINSTAGLAGFLDPASGMEGLERPVPQDIGHALGAYGMGEGIYLVLPILGPSSGRDALGFVGNRAVHPLYYPYSVWDESTMDWTLSITQFVNASPGLIRGYRSVTDNAIDPYGSLKSSYIQARRADIRPKNLQPPNSVIRRQRGL